MEDYDLMQDYYPLLEIGKYYKARGSEEDCTYYFAVQEVNAMSYHNLDDTTFGDYHGSGSQVWDNGGVMMSTTDQWAVHCYCVKVSEEITKEEFELALMKAKLLQ